MPSILPCKLTSLTPGCIILSFRRNYDAHIGGEDNMQTEDFSLQRSFSQGWEIFKDNIGLAIGAFAIYQLITVVIGYIPVVGIFAQILVGLPLAGGLYTLFLRIVKKENPELGILFSNFSNGNNWSRWIGIGMLLVFYMIVAGILCAIVPGVLILLTYFALGADSPLFIATIALMSIAFLVALVAVTMRWLMVYFVGAEGVTARRAIAISEEMTRGIRPQLFWIMFVLGLVQLAGILALGIGYFFTAPLALCCTCVLYLDVKRSRMPEEVQGACCATDTEPLPHGYDQSDDDSGAPESSIES